MFKRLLYICVGLIVFVCTSYFAVVNIPFSKKQKGMKYYTTAEQKPSFKNKQALRAFCKQKELNTNICVLVNYSIPSGKPRFFVYDFDKNKIVYRCRCAHGLGGGSTARIPVFSNSVGSKCSSLGKFVLTGTGSAHFKNCFRLRGLDESNNNAEARGILIHSATIVTKFRLLPWIPLNRSCEGCFTITKGGLLKMHELYNRETNKHILVYAYKSDN